MKTSKTEGDCIGLPLWLTHKLHPSNQPTVTQLDDIALDAYRRKMQLQAKIDANMAAVCISRTFLARIKLRNNKVGIQKVIANYLK